jgi:hypothetical protein
MNKQILIILAVVLLFAVPASAQQARVNHNRTPLRSEPTQSSAMLAYYPAGSALDIISFNDGWYRVRDPKTGQEGYIMATLVDLLPGPIPPPRGLASPGTTAHPPEPKRELPPTPPVTPQTTTLKPGSATPPLGQTAAKKPATNPNRWADRAYVVLNGVYQSGTPAFSEAFSYTEYVEKTTITTEYPTKKGPAFDGGGAVRIWRNLAVGVNVSLAERSTDGSVTGAIPHPFYFNAARSISGTAAIERSENAVHVQALWAIPAGRRLLIALGGGPSFFSVKQSLVQHVTYSESYPYDTATFASASVTQPSASAVGFGGSVDVGYYFSRYVGFGGMVRYTHATVPLTTRDSTLSVDAGGFEAGLGLRFRLPPGKPTKAPAKPPVSAKPVKK